MCFSRSLTPCDIFTRCSFTLVYEQFILSIVVFTKIFLHLIYTEQNYTKKNNASALSHSFFIIPPTFSVFSCIFVTVITKNQK